MITIAASGDNVKENESIELTHYLSYMIVYFVLQVACIITVSICEKKENNQKKMRVRSFLDQSVVFVQIFFKKKKQSCACDNVSSASNTSFLYVHIVFFVIYILVIT